jgi:hypothetical protein
VIPRFDESQQVGEEHFEEQYALSVQIRELHDLIATRGEVAGRSEPRLGKTLSITSVSCDDAMSVASSFATLTNRRTGSVDTCLKKSQQMSWNVNRCCGSSLRTTDVAPKRRACGTDYAPAEVLRHRRVERIERRLLSAALEHDARHLSRARP